MDAATPTVPIPPAAVSSADRTPIRWIVGGLRVACLLTADDTAGLYSLFEFVVPPRDPGPPPHTHTREDEAFYVLEGEHTVEIDGVVTRGGPGAYMFAPRHKPHAFRNETDKPTRVLMVASPGGFEHFFAACGIPDPDPAAPADPPTEQDIWRILDAMPRFGMTPHV